MSIYKNLMIDKKLLKYHLFNHSYFISNEVDHLQV